MIKRIFYVLFALLIINGCAKKQTVKQDIVPVPPVPPATGEENQEPSVRFPDWQSIADIGIIYFEYDKTDLLPQARETLKKNADYLKANPDLDLLVEGHCDERGTTEYNLALAQRRASAVRGYYGLLGIKLDRIGTISYGEEKPADIGHTESAWAKNRRAESKIRSRK